MWLVLNKGFLSIVHKEGAYVVRARDEAHLKAYFPGHPVESNTGTDYRYRIRITRAELAAFLESLPDEVSYSNFKDSIRDGSLRRFASQIWTLGWKTFDGG